MRRYRDTPMDFADAALVRVAERDAVPIVAYPRHASAARFAPTSERLHRACGEIRRSGSARGTVSCGRLELSRSRQPGPEPTVPFDVAFRVAVLSDALRGRMAARLEMSEALWHAVLDRDAHADGLFVYAVRSTGIYCRPSCASRKPRRDRVEFFPAPWHGGIPRLPAMPALPAGRPVDGFARARARSARLCRRRAAP